MTTVNDIEQLFRGNYTAMLTLAARLLHDGETARDIVHDVFASLLASRPDTVTPAYLLKGVRFACLNHIRSISVRDRLECFLAPDSELPDDEPWPDEEDVTRLNGLIDSCLTVQCRRVVRLRFGARLSYAEIARELEISETAVYKHLRHALDILRKNFNENER